MNNNQTSVEAINKYLDEVLKYLDNSPDSMSFDALMALKASTKTSCK